MWDATVADTFAKTNALNSAVLAASAAEEAEDLKRRKYGGLAENYLFEPLAFETAGVCGPSTTKVISEIARRLVRGRGDPREAPWLWQRLSIAIVRGNATCVLNSTKPHQIP